MKCRIIAFLRWSRVCLVTTWGVLYGIDYIYKDVFLGSMICTLLWMLALLLPFSWLHNSKLHPKNMAYLVRQVLDSNPGVDIEKWDENANILSSLFTKTKSGTRRTFFSIKSLQIVLKVNVLEPHLEGKLDDITYMDKIQSANCYLQSPNEKFESLLKVNFRESFLNSELPRDTHTNKLFFYPQSLILGFFICCLQGVTLFMILAELKRKTSFPLIMIMYYQHMSLICYRSLLFYVSTNKTNLLLTYPRTLDISNYDKAIPLRIQLVVILKETI